jgi:hypothetical protein
VQAGVIVHDLDNITRLKLVDGRRQAVQKVSVEGTWLDSAVNVGGESILGLRLKAIRPNGGRPKRQPASSNRPKALFSEAVRAAPPAGRKPAGKPPKAAGIPCKRRWV